MVCLSLSLGDLTLDLTRMPRGAKSAKTCTLDMLKQDGSVPQVSFFKVKHMKGFWPFTVNTEEEEIELAVSLLLMYQSIPCTINLSLSPRTEFQTFDVFEILLIPLRGQITQLNAPR